jgi:hypothetical protein
VPRCSRIIFTLKNASRVITNTEYSNNYFTLFYRIEDSTSSTSLGLANSKQYDPLNRSIFLQNYYGTTNWIVGSPNSFLDLTTISSSNYTQTNIKGYGYNSNSFSISSGLSFNVTLPSTNNAPNIPSFSSDYFIYCRIALNLKNLVDFSFSNVTAQIY